jgi:ribosomal protein L33
MAKKGNRAAVWMVPADKSVIPYRFRTWRNKVNEGEKLSIMKYHPMERKHVKFIETK